MNRLKTTILLGGLTGLVIAVRPASGGGGAAGRVQFFRSKKVRAFSNKGH